MVDMIPTKAFNEFEDIIRELQRLSRKLMDVLDKQAKAVISGKKDDIERYVEKYTNLKASFKEQEHRFINHLQLLVEESDNVDELRLESLKEVFPQSQSIINEWQDDLGKQTRDLKQKHQNLNRLLEFAVEKNVTLIQSIFSLHNEKNIHYSSEGNKEEISSGIAVNKEA